MGQLLKCATSLAAKTKETDDNIKTLEMEIERQKTYIAAQDRTIEQRDERNDDLRFELNDTLQQVQELQRQQRKAKKILDRIPEDVRKQIDRQIKREAHEYER